MRDQNISTKYNSKLVQFVVLLIVFFGLYFLVEPSENNILWRLPPLIAGMPFLINDFASYLMYDFMPIEIYDADIDDYEKSPLIKEITTAEIKLNKIPQKAECTVRGHFSQLIKFPNIT